MVNTVQNSYAALLANHRPKRESSEMIRRTLRYLTKPELNEDRRKVKNWLMPLLPEDAIIVEAGSHWGEDTIWLGRYWPRGTVHAFEPAPFLYGKTTEHTSWIRNV